MVHFFLCQVKKFRGFFSEKLLICPVFSRIRRIKELFLFKIFLSSPYMQKNRICGRNGYIFHGRACSKESFIVLGCSILQLTEKMCIILLWQSRITVEY